MALHVETHTPAFLAAFVSPDPIDITDLDDTRRRWRRPAMSSCSRGTPCCLAWPATRRITSSSWRIDGNDHTALREGTIHTAEAPHILVTFHEVHVVRDGDDSERQPG